MSGRVWSKWTGHFTVGTRYNKWTAMENTIYWSGKSPKRFGLGDALVKCKCDCGTEKLVRARFLVSGRSKSCGHDRFYNRKPRRRTKCTHLNAKPNTVCLDCHFERSWKKQGIIFTLNEYDVLLEQQDGKCAICKNSPNGRRLDVDHNHTNGKVRGLLCWRCNTQLAWTEKYEAIALSYLHK